MWVADMDFQAPPAVREALAEKAAHGIFGDSDPEESCFETLGHWFETHHDGKTDPHSAVLTPGIVFALCTWIRCLT